MFGNESKTQAEILKMKPYAEFLIQRFIKIYNGDEHHVNE